jgi:hypothetical protein
VGGKSLTWGGITLRLSDFEFKAADRDGNGRPWPISHADLAPYYEKLERRLAVHGQADGLAQLPDGIYERPLPFTPAEAHLQACLRQELDLPLIHSRGFALRRQAPDPLADPWPRSCSQGGCLKEALATGRVSLRSGAVVSHVELEPRSGRAPGWCSSMPTAAGRDAGQGQPGGPLRFNDRGLPILLHSEPGHQEHGLEDALRLLGHAPDGPHLHQPFLCPAQSSPPPAQRSFRGRQRLHPQHA